MTPENFIDAQALWIDPSAVPNGHPLFNALVGRAPCGLLELFRMVYRSGSVTTAQKRAAFERLLQIRNTNQTRRAMHDTLLNIGFAAYEIAGSPPEARGTRRFAQISECVAIARSANSISLLEEKTRHALILLCWNNARPLGNVFEVDYEQDGPLIAEIDMRLFEVLCEAAEGDALYGLLERVRAWQTEIPGRVLEHAASRLYEQTLGRLNRPQAVSLSGAAVAGPLPWASAAPAPPPALAPLPVEELL